jgi:DNA mismatch repair protein MutS
MGALIEYLDITQKGQLPRLQRPVKELTQRVMQIDAATRRNLEITQSIQSGGRVGSLLATVDRTGDRGRWTIVRTAYFVPLDGC